MKRIMLCFLVILFVAVPVYAVNGHLVEYATGEPGDKYYFIPESLKISEGKICVSSLRDFGVSQNGISKRISSVAFNPDEKQYKLLATTSFAANGKLIEKREYPDDGWRNIVAHSSVEALLMAVNKYIAQNSVVSKNPEQEQAPAKKYTSATGFFITPDVVVTNNHVVNAAKKIEVIYNSEMKADATVIYTEAGSDLASLKVVGLEKNISPLVLGNSIETKEGTRIYTVGFPLPAYIGTTAKITEGLVSGITGFKGDLRQFAISASIQPGNSGGPLLNEKPK